MKQSEKLELLESDFNKLKVELEELKSLVQVMRNEIKINNKTKNENVKGKTYNEMFGSDKRTKVPAWSKPYMG